MIVNGVLSLSYTHSINGNQGLLQPNRRNSHSRRNRVTRLMKLLSKRYAAPKMTVLVNVEE